MSDLQGLWGQSWGDLCFLRTHFSLLLPTAPPNRVETPDFANQVFSRLHGPGGVATFAPSLFKQVFRYISPQPGVAKYRAVSFAQAGAVPKPQPLPVQMMRPAVCA
jgi:hypothetical protein